MDVADGDLSRLQLGQQGQRFVQSLFQPGQGVVLPDLDGRPGVIDDGVERLGEGQYLASGVIFQPTKRTVLFGPQDDFGRFPLQDGRVALVVGVHERLIDAFVAEEVENRLGLVDAPLHQRVAVNGLEIPRVGRGGHTEPLADSNDRLRPVQFGEPLFEPHLGQCSGDDAKFQQGHSFLPSRA